MAYVINANISQDVVFLFKGLTNDDSLQGYKLQSCD